MIYDGAGVSCFTGVLLHRNVIVSYVFVCVFLLLLFLFTGNLCCDLWVCCAPRQCVLIVHLLCCMAMFVFDAISQAAASRCFKAWYGV